MNYSIDKMLNIIPSKYQLVYVAAKRAEAINEEYKSVNNLDRALEEIQKNLIHLKEE